MSKEKHELKVTERTEFGSAASRRARRANLVPAVVYGHGAEPRGFLIDAKEWEHIAKQDVQIVQLQPEKGKEINVLIKDVQFDYLSGTTTHIDFLEVKMDEVIHASVPIHTIGTPAGLSQGGVLEHLLHEIEVTSTPLALPESIEVDISELALHDALTIGGLNLPEGVTALGEPDQIIVHVIEQRVDAEGTTDEEEGEQPAADAGVSTEASEG
jgi:large subunit ribosomal protein L25